MCKAPTVPAQKDPEKPQFLRNRYLDSAIGQGQTVNALRSGRSSLRIRLDGSSAQGPSQPNILPPTTGPGPTPLPFSGGGGNGSGGGRGLAIGSGTTMNPRRGFSIF